MYTLDKVIYYREQWKLTNNPDMHAEYKKYLMIWRNMEKAKYQAKLNAMGA